ncbi:MAG: hypothetical protein R2911_24320 [Caldilineaceae bacterium]
MNEQLGRDDRFYYGYRRTVIQDRTGQPSYIDEPLTAADFLNPQPDDLFELGTQHDDDVRDTIPNLAVPSPQQLADQRVAIG